ncbi:MAG: class I SAM-dependent methyltransferase [Bacteroidales bacterium]|nr:class I SAM-dependent methyltransferase [Bacteroidales bacterium]
MDKSIFEKIHQLHKKGWWFGEARNRMVMSLLRRHDKQLESHLILDIGSSEGAFLDYLNKRQLSFYGIDIDEDAIKFCASRGLGDKIKYGNIKDIPFPPESFNIATALDIVEHVDDDGKAMDEIHRILVKGGIALVIVPAHKWLWSQNDVAYHHQRRYSRKEFQALATKYGFTIRQWSYFNFFLFPLFVCATLYSKLFPRRVKTSTVLKPLPKPVNWVLRQILNVETWIIAGLGIRLPFGSSMIYILSKSK